MTKSKAVTVSAVPTLSLPTFITHEAQILAHQSTIEAMEKSIFNFHQQSAGFHIAQIFKDLPDLQSFRIETRSIPDYEGGKTYHCFAKKVKFLEPNVDQADWGDDEDEFDAGDPADQVDHGLSSIHSQVANTLHKKIFERTADSDQLEMIMGIVLSETDYVQWREASGIQTPRVKPPEAPEEIFNMKDFLDKLHKGEVKNFGVPKV